MSAPQKILSVFSLVMINVVAIDSLRTLPISAEYGTALLFFYGVAALLFFIPSALVTAELATGWPTNGGIYIWVREAFGVRAGLFVIWMQWIYNVVWYPTIMSFIVATLAYLFDPTFAENKTYLLVGSLGIFWFATLLNCLGMKVSSWISAVGAIMGTLLPMLFIMVLAAVWLFQGNPAQISFTWSAALPDLNSFANISFFVGVLFGLMGLEMSAVHASEVRNPSRDYPAALLISAVIILISLICASLAIAIVVPHEQINLVTGMLNAFALFFKTFHLESLMPVVILMIVLGAFTGMAAWSLGPAKGLMIAAREVVLPSLMLRTNSNGAPTGMLILQGILFTILCSVFLFFPTINESFWLLSAMTAQLALFVYIALFITVIKLRYKNPQVTRAFKIPGGRVGLWLVSGAGLIICIAAIIFGFFPPPDVNVGNVPLFVGILFGGMVVFCIPPFFFKVR